MKYRVNLKRIQNVSVVVECDTYQGSFDLAEKKANQGKGDISYGNWIEDESYTSIEKYRIGEKIKFAEEKQRYTVQACNKRFLICTKPYNPKHTVFYTIVDLQKNIRGCDNQVFHNGYETKEDCERALKRLVSTNDEDVFEISYRNRIPLKIEKQKELV
jgi:hypothetical protein